MTVQEFNDRYIIVHHCAGCGTLLGWDRMKETFCDVCMPKWNFALNRDCGNCFKPVRECTCMPKVLEKQGVPVLRRLFFYTDDECDNPEINIIYNIKGKKISRFTDFLAAHLIPAIIEETDIMGLDRCALIVTGVPRAKRNKRVYGFDHSELLARSVAKQMGIDHAKLLKTRVSSREQKKLGVNERARNSKRSICLKKNANADGKYILLVDDIVTTGASMARCAELLKHAGAKGVMCFSLSSANKM